MVLTLGGGDGDIWLITINTYWFCNLGSVMGDILGSNRKKHTMPRGLGAVRGLW